MQCSFCDNPAAHPSTGTQYTERYIACHACTVRFHIWLLSHVNGKGRGKKQKSIASRPGALEFQPKLSFYEAAALFPSSRINNPIE